MSMNNDELIRKKFEFFKNRDKPVYFKLKESDNFRNGKVVEISDDSIIFNEIEMGEIPIYFEEIQPDSMAESKHWRFKT